MRLCSLAVLLAALPVWGAEVYQPLFFVERSLNMNVVHYDAKLTNGHFDPRQPIVAYWIIASENGRREELSLLERTAAYGFTAKRDGSDDSYVMRIVSNHHEIRVTLKDGVARAETMIGGHHAYLRKIYVMTHKRLTMNITDFAELQGIDVDTGEECRERVTQSK